jgi:hypothetical protein
MILGGASVVRVIAFAERGIALLELAGFAEKSLVQAKRRPNGESEFGK